MFDATTPDPARGGRPYGSKGHHNDGLMKRCGCPRRQWPKCRHPWYFGFGHGGRLIRLALHKYANKSAGYVMSKSEAESLRDAIRGEIRAGRFRQTPAPAAPTDRLTVEDVTQRYLDAIKADPGRRAHRLPHAQAQLALICRTLVPGAHGQFVRFGDLAVEDVGVGHLDAFRDARRALLKHSEAERQARASQWTEARDAVKALPRGQRGKRWAEALKALPRVSAEVPHRRGGETGCNRHF